MDDPKENELSTEIEPPAIPMVAPAQSRRTALTVLSGIGLIAYVGAVVGPAVPFLAGSGDGGAGERWIRVARLEDLPEDLTTRIEVIGDVKDAFTLHQNQVLGVVWVLRKGDSVSALSAVCPHLGCAIDLSADAKAFGCPCHSAKFDLDGKSTSGPSPRDMDPLDTRVKDGWLEVDYRRFRVGIESREEA